MALMTHEEIEAAGAAEQLFSELEADVIEFKRLFFERKERPHFHAVLQPIFDLATQKIVAYEALIRGPVGTPLHTPAKLFPAARAAGLIDDLHIVCVNSAIKAFASAKVDGLLFINMYPQIVSNQAFDLARAARNLAAHGLKPEQVVIELTEDQQTFDFGQMREALKRFHDAGYRVAIDDLGEGFASLRLWSELKPTFVKIDKHFVQNSSNDPHKLNFLRAIAQIAEASGTSVIAEGVETIDELKAVQQLGIRYVQGYLIGRPAVMPDVEPPANVRQALNDKRVSVFGWAQANPRIARKAIHIAQSIQPANLTTPVKEVLLRFRADHNLLQVPVIQDDKLVGLIRRSFLEELLVISQRNGMSLEALTCGAVMSAPPLAVDGDLDLPALSSLLGQSEGARFGDGFAVLKDGQYVGFGYAQQLLREINTAHLRASRHLNPLTGLPGQVPITEHLVKLIDANVKFTVLFAEIYRMRGFNDELGFLHGDQLIADTAQILAEVCATGLDLVGHLSGGRFVALLQSDDWERKASAVVKMFEQQLHQVIPEPWRSRGVFEWTNKSGTVTELRNWPRLAIGVLPLAAGELDNRHEVMNHAKHICEAVKTRDVTGYAVGSVASASAKIADLVIIQAHS